MSHYDTSRPGASTVRPAVSSSHGPLPAAMLTRLADALSVPDGGFSIHLCTGREARRGYAVAVYPALERRIAGRAVGLDILAYATEFAATLTHPHVVLGGWRNPADGLAYLDISVVVNDRQFAVLLAATHGQVAIWDFERRESLEVLSAPGGAR